jgi:hypothetical protein
MCNNATASFREQLEFLKRESDEYFCTEFESAEAETKETIRIKSGLFDLINKAKEGEDDSISSEVKRAVIEYICDVCGHSGDLEILRNHTSSGLSPEELEYIRTPRYRGSFRCCLFSNT